MMMGSLRSQSMTMTSDLGGNRQETPRIHPRYTRRANASLLKSTPRQPSRWLSALLLRVPSRTTPTDGYIHLKDQHHQLSTPMPNAHACMVTLHYMPIKHISAASSHVGLHSRPDGRSSRTSALTVISRWTRAFFLVKSPPCSPPPEHGKSK